MNTVPAFLYETGTAARQPSAIPSHQGIRGAGGTHTCHSSTFQSPDRDRSTKADNLVAVLDPSSGAAIGVLAATVGQYLCPIGWRRLIEFLKHRRWDFGICVALDQEQRELQLAL